MYCIRRKKMKVILVNGSPNHYGCTYTALCEVEKTLNEGGVKTEHFWIGNKPLTGCIGCGFCGEHGKCQYDDTVNSFVEKAGEYDGFVFGAPVHFASAAASMSGFMDRVFYSDSRAGRNSFYLKAAAVIVSARRAGTTAALDQLNKYLLYAEMPVVSSRYWNMVHGNTPDEVKKDLEGLQIMRVLGRNMAWLLRSIEAGRAARVPAPEKEERINTNFI